MPAPRKVLVVDDDRSIVRAVALRLRAAGYSTAEAYDGESGAACAETEVPDLVLADVVMPRGGGFGLVEKLRLSSKSRATRIILMSASADEELPCRAMESGARAFLRKPFDKAALLQAIERALA